jgi:hypothetical protein
MLSVCLAARQVTQNPELRSFGRVRFYSFFARHSKFFADDSESNQQWDDQVADGKRGQVCLFDSLRGWQDSNEFVPLAKCFTCSIERLLG